MTSITVKKKGGKKERKKITTTTNCLHIEENDICIVNTVAKKMLKDYFKFIVYSRIMRTNAVNTTSRQWCMKFRHIY